MCFPSFARTALTQRQPATRSSLTSSSKIGEDLQYDETTTQKRIDVFPQTVIEAYQQASTSLEDRGADPDMALTTQEFKKDVVIKDLTRIKDITDLTHLYEEAKFSDHHIDSTTVEKAQELAKEIIFSGSKIVDVFSEEEE